MIPTSIDSITFNKFELKRVCFPVTSSNIHKQLYAQDLQHFFKTQSIVGLRMDTQNESFWSAKEYNNISPKPSSGIIEIDVQQNMIINDVDDDAL